MHMSQLNQFGALTTMMQDRMAQAFNGLSPRAASILITLRSRGALAISRIGAIAGIAQPTATRLIDGLEKSGHVERLPRDGRVVVVALTETGTEAAEKLQRARLDVVQRFIDPLDPHEREMLGGLIEKMIVANTESRTDARTTCRYCDHSVCHGDACPINRRATELESRRQAAQQSRSEQ